jgi:hypothetical protein
VDIRDAFERAVWTAVEAGLAILVITDVATVKAAAVAMVAALIAALKTFAKTKIASS